MALLGNVYGIGGKKAITEAVDYTADVTPYDYSKCVDFQEAAFQSIMECETNWNNLHQNLVINELNYLRENGVEFIYEAVNIKGLISKGVAMIQAWLGKVYGVIEKFMVTIRSKITGTIKAIPVKKDELAKMTKFDKDKGKVTKWNDFQKALAVMDKMDFADMGSVDVLSKDRVADNAKDSSTWVSSVAKDWGVPADNITVKSLYDVMCKETSLIAPKAAWCAEVIFTYKDAIKRINAAKNEAKNSANSLIKNLKSFEKEAGKDDAEVANNVHTCLAAITKINSMNTTLLTAKLKCMIDTYNFAVSIARGYIAAERKASKTDTKDQKKATKAYGKGGKQEVMTLNSTFEDVLDFDLV